MRRQLFDISHFRQQNLNIFTHIDIWGKVFKNRPSEIAGRQPLKKFEVYGLLKQTIAPQNFLRLSSINFIWSILEYFIPCVCLFRF